ncbi:MAG: hypothetical protein KAH32_02720 [Chlamydiia bacterium]|nr:hypothetical protein [Chlamydiia bacterium]
MEVQERLITNWFIEKVYVTVDEGLKDIYDSVIKSHKEHKIPAPGIVEFLNKEYISDSYSEAEAYFGVYRFLYTFGKEEGKIPAFHLKRSRAEGHWEVRIDK